jgi:adhesin transport system membrane fusion protein
MGSKNIFEHLNKPRHDIKGRRLLSESIQIEEELVPAFVKPMVWLIASMVVGFVVWASVTPVKEIAQGIGEIMPSDKIKLVQHLDGGVISEILVEERQEVQKGQVLFRLNDRQAMAEVQQMQARLAALRLREERIAAFTEHRIAKIEDMVGSDEYQAQVMAQQDTLAQQRATRSSNLAILEAQIEQRQNHLKQIKEGINAARKDLALSKELLAMREDLAENKLISRTILLETRRTKVASEGEVQRLEKEYTLVQKELDESIARRADMANQIQRDALKELSEVRAEKSEVEQQLEKQSSIFSRLEITAPEQGMVQELQINTIGQVIQPAALLMKIVPKDAELEVEVRVKPKDIAFIRNAQPVKMRISSYDYSRFGYASGYVKRISAFSILDDTDAKHEPFFKVWISLDRAYLGNDPTRNPLQPGMSVEAEIITGEKTLLTYLLKPVADLLSRSFNER